VVYDPVQVLKDELKNELIRKNCPPELINELVSKSNYKKWPKDLKSFDIRDINRHFLTNYICRKLFDRKFALVFSKDNLHMPQNLRDTKNGFVVSFVTLDWLQKVCKRP